VVKVAAKAAVKVAAKAAARVAVRAAADRSGTCGA
jgi:hypothetical protein